MCLKERITIRDILVLQVFNGNSDSDSKVTNWFSHPVRAQYIRVEPQSWQGVIAARVEIHGCYETYPSKYTIFFGGQGDMNGYINLNHYCVL